eukprot:UN05383
MRLVHTSRVLTNISMATIEYNIMTNTCYLFEPIIQYSGNNNNNIGGSSNMNNNTTPITSPYQQQQQVINNNGIPNLQYDLNSSNNNNTHVNGIHFIASHPSPNNNSNNNSNTSVCTSYVDFVLENTCSHSLNQQQQNNNNNNTNQNTLLGNNPNSPLSPTN